MAPSKPNPTCPECGNLLMQPGRCGLCGWAKAEEDRTAEERRAAKARAGQCSYQPGSRRCPLNGVYAALSAKNRPGRWFCFIHDEPDHRLPPGPDAEAAMDWLEANWPELVEARYRRASRGERVERWDPQALPAVVRAPGEAASEYHARMMALAAGMLESPAKRAEVV